MAAALGFSALAAESDIVIEYKGSGDSVNLSVKGFNGSVYGVQLELVLDGEYPDARFLESGSEAYNPGDPARVENGKTHITVYLSTKGSSPLGNGSSLDLGVLSVGGDFEMPETAVLTLLNPDLQPYDKANETEVNVQRPRSTVSGGSTVNISRVENGTVSTDKRVASSGSTVTLTAKPNAGYVLESISVTAGGKSVALKELGGGRYSFVMPNSAVNVSAVFKAEDENTEDKPIPFGDVAASDWFYEAVKYVYNKGMMNGTDDVSFSPYQRTTRGMIVTILWRLEGEPDAEGREFNDVKAGQYYAAAVEWASANGIVDGYDDGRFYPDNAITREQLAAILYRYAAYKNYDIQASANLGGYTDSTKISDYAKSAMAWANAEGLITGVTDTELDPAGTANRAQAATILMRIGMKAE